MKTIQNKTKKMIETEVRCQMNIEEVLRNMYVDRELPARTMATKLGISYVTVLDWLEQSGIYSRDLNI